LLTKFNTVYVILLLCLSSTIFAQHQEQDTMRIKNSIGLDSLRLDSGILVLDSLGEGRSFLNDSIEIERPKKNSFLESPVTYKGTDSIVVDLETDQMHIYGEAELSYKTTHLDAAYIRIDMAGSQLFAQGQENDTSCVYEKRPNFTDNDQSFVSDSMLYSFETEKGKIYRAKTQEGDGYIHGAEIKMTSKEVLYVRDGLYTTCQNDTPHYHIHAKRLKLIKNDKIITGAANLKVDGAPTPLVVPFGFFPNSREQSSGIVLPTYGWALGQGYYLNRGGYYWAASDYYDLELTADLFSSGSWAAYLTSNYKKRYKYNGSFGLDYSVVKSGLKELQSDSIATEPYFSKLNNIILRWSHTQDAKANPKISFRSQVQAGSTSALQTNLTASNSEFLQNTFNSNISFSRNLTLDKLKTSGLFAVSAAHNQNLRDSTITIDAPNVDFSITTFKPLSTNKNVGEKWFERITVGYTLNYKSQLNTKLDSNFLSFNTLNNFENGLKHSIPIAFQTKLLKFFTLNQTVTYTGVGYFKTYNKFYTQFDQKEQENFETRFSTFHTGNYNARLTTKVYGMYPFKEGKNIKAIRHVITPQIGYQYSPDFSAPNFGYFNSYERTIDTVIDTIDYSRFQGLFGGPSGNASSSITFSMINDVQIKLLDKKDSTGKQTKKLNLLDNVNMSSAYNMRADSLNLSNINFRGNINLVEGFSINFTGSVDPYQIDFETRKIVDQFEISKWSENRRIGRLTQLTMATSYTLRGKQTEERTTENGTEAELEDIENNPDLYVDFTIPWSLAMRYNYTYSKPIYEPSIIHTISFDGSVNLTPNWKIGLQTSYDLVNKEFALPTVNVFRDLHCWQMTFQVITSGVRQSYQFDLNVKSPVLQDLKISRNLQWYDRR